MEQAAVMDRPVEALVAPGPEKSAKKAKQEKAPKKAKEPKEEKLKYRTGPKPNLKEFRRSHADLAGELKGQALLDAYYAFKDAKKARKEARKAAKKSQQLAKEAGIPTALHSAYTQALQDIEKQVEALRVKLVKELNDKVSSIKF